MSVLAFLLVIALVFGSPAEEENSRGGSQRDLGYAEQCRATNLWKGQLGYVNVLAFLDPSWHYSFRQAVMLELLKKRLERSGFLNILFFVVAPSSNLPENSVENNIEIRTWKEISKNMFSQEYLWGTEETQPNDQAKIKENGIVFLRDTPEIGIWDYFRASRDEVVVLDRCGKLTYQVIIPWSILYFPYVKAAILSTYKEYPCGPCNEQPSPISNTMEYEKYLFENVKGTEKSSDSYTEITADNLKLNLTLFPENSTLLSKEANVEEKHEKTSTLYSTHTNLDINETGASLVTTDTPLTKDQTITVPAENLRQYNNAESNGPFINDKIEPTTEVFSQQGHTKIVSTDSNIKTTEDYEGTQGSDSLKEQRVTTSNNLLFTIISTPIGTRKHPEELENIKDSASDESAKSQIKENQDLPLRIILYAPHIHQENQTTKEYTHLILKSGSPDYHNHFHSMSGIYDQESKVNPNSTSKLANSPNESPGVYGEIAYYWRTTEEDEFNNQDENTELLELEDDTIEGSETKIDDTIDNEDDTLVQSSDDDVTDASMKMKVDEDSEEFVQRRLIEHYNKLVPWIHYIL
ncbi:uncharacterized protein LOC144476937 [Augochlora pura]